MLSYFAKSLIDAFKPESRSRLRLFDNPNSYKVKDFIITINIPVILYSNLWKICDTNINFEIRGDLLKLIISYIFDIDNSDSWDDKIVYDFANGMIFDFTPISTKSTKNKTLARLLSLPAIMAVHHENPNGLKDPAVAKLSFWDPPKVPNGAKHP